MTDDEIIASVKEAKEALTKCLNLIQPVSDELASRASKLLGREFDGQIGCYDEDLTLICSHNTGKWPVAKNRKEKNQDYDIKEELEQKVERLFEGTGFSYRILG